MFKRMLPILTARLRDLADPIIRPAGTQPEQKLESGNTTCEEPAKIIEDPADRRIRRRRWSPDDVWGDLPEETRSRSYSAFR